MQNSCPITSGDGVDGMPLAMAYVPKQSFVNLYSPSDALANGTLFGDLNLPYCAGGKR
ncbi:MAG: spore coat associated protein CotJA [Clostridia bacterium]|nr:spore coat associated protein CotJA [Clostridia bacterium]MBO4428715.1 spore coat associated protein CotJA [Clostridia bacterium]